MDQKARFTGIIKTTLLAVFVLVAIAAPPVGAETLYAVDAQNRLLEVDSLTAATTVVGDLGITLTCFGGACFAGLDFNPIDGKLYVSVSSTVPNPESLYTVDLATGAASFAVDVALVGPGLSLLQNMAFSPQGVLFGSEASHLYSIDIGTGAGQHVGTDSSHDDDALAFGPDGTLYAIDGFSAFYRIDPTSGSKSTISGTPCWVSLTFGNDGNLYCTDGPAGNLYRINPTDGAATFVGNTGVDIVGLATPPSVPTSVDQCKKEGWKAFTNPSFKNQGQCVSFVVSHRGSH